METRRDVYQAIADPTRREIITMVASKELNLNAIADKFEVSRQAISLHIKILNECGLISIRQQGRERFCEAKLDQLEEVTNWVAKSTKLWKQQFNKLDTFLQEVQNKKQ